MKKIVALTLVSAVLGGYAFFRIKSKPAPVETAQETRALPAEKDQKPKKHDAAEIDLLLEKARKIVAEDPPEPGELPLLEKVQAATAQEKAAFDQNIKQMDKNLAIYEEINRRYVKARQDQSPEGDAIQQELEAAQADVLQQQEKMMAAYKEYSLRFSEVAVALESERKHP